MPKPFGRITTYQDDIYTRYDPLKFVGRDWLVAEIARFRDAYNRKHLIIVGEPGSGKSTFIAYLAKLWNCPRHFIREDNIRGVSGVDPRNFLISLAHQLYLKYGSEIFETNVRRTTKVAVDVAKDKAEVIGRLINELCTPLPFLPVTHDDVQLHVREATGESRVIGEQIDRLIDHAMLLDERTLLHMALLSPLKKLQELYPEEKVVILIDALDESLEHQGQRTQIIDIIPSDSNFPPNLQLVMTSRRGTHLIKFRADDFLYLDEKDSDDKKKGYRFRQKHLKDARDYIDKRFTETPLSSIMSLCPQDEITAFISAIEKNGDGNFLYLYHFLNEVARIASTGVIDLKEINVPRDLDEIYRVFAVEKIKKRTLDTIHFTAEGTIIDTLKPRLQQMKGMYLIQVTDQRVEDSNERAGIFRRDTLPHQQVTLLVEDSNETMRELYPLISAAGVRDWPFEIQQGKGFNAWEEKYLPLLGVLSVIREPVSKGELAAFSSVPRDYVDSIVDQILQFLEVIDDTNGDRFRFYHSSFREYLLDEKRNKDFYLNPFVCHEKIVAYYRKGCTNWEEVNWDRIEGLYPFHHLTSHLIALERFEDLYTLVVVGGTQQKWAEAHFHAEDSYAGYLYDLELVWSWVTNQVGWNIGRQIRCVLLSSSIHSSVGNIVPQLLPIFIHSGRLTVESAFDAMQRMPHAGQRALALRMVAPFLTSKYIPNEKTREEMIRGAMSIANVLIDDITVDEQDRIDTHCAIVQQLPPELQAEQARRLWMGLQYLEDEEYLTTKIVELWRLFPESLQDQVFSWLKARETLFIDVLADLANAFSPAQMVKAQRAVNQMVNGRKRILGQVQLAMGLTDEQKSNLLKMCVAIAEEYMDIIPLIDLLPHLFGTQRERAANKSWQIIQQIPDKQSAIFELGRIMPYLSATEKYQAFISVWNTALAIPLTFPIVQALFKLVDTLPEEWRDKERQHVRKLAQLVINDTETHTAQISARFSHLITLFRWLDDQQKRQVVMLAYEISNQSERACALLEIAELDLLKYLPGDIQNTLISTVKQWSQKIDDDSERATVLAILSKYASESIHTQALQEAECIVDGLPEITSLDKKDKALVYLGLLAYLPLDKRIEATSRIVMLLQSFTSLDRIIGMFIHYVPKEELNELQESLSNEVGILLGKEVAKNRQRTLLQSNRREVDQLSDEQKTEQICAVLKALKKKGGDKKSRAYLIELLQNWDGSTFFTEEHRRLWCDVLQVCAHQERIACMRNLIVLTPLLLLLGGNSTQYELFKALCDVARWWQ
jgi:hypothetical protein